MYSVGRGQHGVKGQGQTEVFAKSHHMAFQKSECSFYIICFFFFIGKSHNHS